MRMNTIKEYINELEIRLQANGEKLPSMREDIDLTVLEGDGLTIEEMLEQGAEFDFSLALSFLKEGLTVARKGWKSWNRKDIFIYLVNGMTIPKSNLRNEAALQVVDSPTETVKIHSHIDMRAADGSIVVGWIASQSDMLADDWFIVG